ncbi:MAG TPA: hypothetical protein VGF99_05570 [Myxococcota bacterium]
MSVDVTSLDEAPMSASAEEVLAALELIDQHLDDDDEDDALGIIALDADVVALDAAIRAAAPGWSNGEGLRVLARVDQVMIKAIARRSRVQLALEQHGASKRAAARYGAF